MIVWGKIMAELEVNSACALVSVIATQGSAPRDSNTYMIVTNHGFRGTIGGGMLEWQVLAKTQAALKGGRSQHITTHVLGPDMGQCCGGRVQLAVEVFDASDRKWIAEMAAREHATPFDVVRDIAGKSITQRFGLDARPVYLFGAGHVGRALVLALAPLPFAITWVDSRIDAFPAAMPANVTPLQTDALTDVVANAQPDGFAFVMSHSHALDFAIVDAALRNRNIAKTGLIGSETKRARFENRLRAAGVDEQRIKTLICPIGEPGISSKHPAAIAAATATQILRLDEECRHVIPDLAPLTQQRFVKLHA